MRISQPFLAPSLEIETRDFSFEADLFLPSLLFEALLTSLLKKDSGLPLALVVPDILLAIDAIDLRCSPSTSDVSGRLPAVGEATDPVMLIASYCLNFFEIPDLTS